MSEQQLPVVVIGAGPAGLAAAAHLNERGIGHLVLESGPAAASAVREWSHVRLFSTWGELVDPAAEKLLAPTGWTKPDAASYPTGGDWADKYLQPLADGLGEQVRYQATVTGVSRAGRDRIVDADRESQPFVVHFTTPQARSASSPAPSSTPPEPGPHRALPARAACPPSARRPPPSASVTAFPISRTRPCTPAMRASAPP